MMSLFGLVLHILRVSNFTVSLGSLLVFHFRDPTTYSRTERERERERENHRCDVMVWASLSHSHGIRIYCLPWVFIWFSILRLQQLVVEERERERKNHSCHDMVWANNSYSHGIRFYYFPCVFVWFSILGLKELVVGEREIENHRCDRERTTGVMS